MSAGFEGAVVDLGDQHGCGRLSDRAEHRQTPDLFRVGEASAVVGKRFPSVGDYLFDLLGDEVVASQHAFNVAPEERRQRPTVSGSHSIETFSQALADAFTGEPNPMQREKPFDAADDADALLNKILSLALDALRVLLLDTRNLHIPRHLAVTRQPGTQCARHALSIKTIRLGPTATARH